MNLQKKYYEFGIITYGWKQFQELKLNMLESIKEFIGGNWYGKFIIKTYL